MVENLAIKKEYADSAQSTPSLRLSVVNDVWDEKAVVYDAAKTNSLDLSNPEFEEILQVVQTLLLDFYANIQHVKGYNAVTQPVLESVFKEMVPLEGIDFTTLIHEIKDNVIRNATGNFGPNYFGYVISGSNQISTVAELLVSTLNQNIAKWHMAPSLIEIEKRVIQWTIDLLGYQKNAGGVMVSGGSSANLTGLNVARNLFFQKYHINENGLYQVPPFRIYCSEQTHNSIEKSVALLGLGTDNIRYIATQPDFTICTTQLEKVIEEDIHNGYIPFCIIGNAGTVNTGSVDDLDALSAIARKYEAWFHIDGSYGILASTLEELRPLFKGVEKADSIALDFHKWLYQPFEAGMVLVKDFTNLRETYFNHANYLNIESEEIQRRVNFNEYNFQLSRSSKAFKIWMSLKFYGFNSFRRMIAKDISLANYLKMQLEYADDFELKSTGPLAIVCFRYKGNLVCDEQIDQLNKQLITKIEQDGKVFLTGTKLNNEFVLRVCIINHRTQKASIDTLIQTIRELARVC